MLVFSKLAKKIIPAFLLTVNALGCTVSLTAAWFMDKSHAEINGKASINKSYFEGGTGTEDDPFLIKYPIQFYYFSWLQDMGYFNEQDSENPGHYKQYHFQIIADIDMAGYNLPPAGSSQYPFIGSIDGDNGTGGSYTISNVNITNTDYTDEPENIKMDNRDYQIMGVFGVVGSYGSMPYSFNSEVNYVHNINFEKITVSSPNSSNTQLLAGLVAGYVNDNTSDSVNSLSNIVVSGTSTIASTATTPLSINPSNNLSKYTLVGYTNKASTAYVQDVTFKTPNLSTSAEEGQSVIVDDSDGNGGDLVIAPSGLKESAEASATVLYNPFGSNVTSGSREIDGAAKLPNTDRKAAYYYASVSSHTPKPQPTNFYIYSGSTPLEFSGSINTISVTLGNSTLVSGYSSSEAGFQSFVNYTTSGYKVNSEYNGLTMGNDISNWNSIRTGQYPNNCIWFQPMNTGHCFISFGIENNSGDSYASLYRYKRDPNTGAVTNKQELRLILYKTDGLGNGNIGLFDIYINDTSYEYCIGNSTGITGKSTPAYFFFLKLAGTDAQGGTGIKDAITDTKYAVYEQYTYGASTMDTLDGANFFGDSLATFQLNTMSQTYTFVSAENTATVNESPGGQHVSQTKTPYGNNTTMQIITGYNDNDEVTLILQKEVTGSTILFYYYTPTAGVITPTNEAAIGRYFGENAKFSNTDLLKYHHQIASDTAFIIPTTASTITKNYNIETLTAYAITIATIKADTLIDSATSVSYTVSLIASDGTVYSSSQS